MPDEPQPSQDHSAELAQGRFASMRDRLTKNRQQARKKRITASPPNSGEYMLIGAIAVLNDGLDWISFIFTFTGVWLLILKIIDFATSAALGIWSVARGVKKQGSGGGTIAGRLKNRVLRWIATTVIEIIPWVGEIVPTWTILVLHAYWEHKTAYETAQSERRNEQQEARQQEQYSYRQEELSAQHETAGEAA